MKNAANESNKELDEKRRINSTNSILKAIAKNQGTMIDLLEKMHEKLDEIYHDI